MKVYKSDLSTEPVETDHVDKPVKKRKPRTKKPTVSKTDSGNFYHIDNILKENADYNIIIGQRGNGKTYAVQEYLIHEFLNHGNQCFLLRRWVEDVQQKNAMNFWDPNLINHLSEWTNRRFTNIIMRTGRYILVSYDEKGKPIIDELNTLGYVWDINESERLKGQSYPYVTNIVYEEFISLSNDGYIPNEVMYFLNIISTIVRDRTNVKIWMLGNTVNPYNPYFKHFGINAMQLKQGTISTITEQTTGCKVAIEFCEKRKKTSVFGSSDKYYAFGSNDGTSDMIISGKWQFPKYPTMKYPKKAQLLTTIAVSFDNKNMLLKLFIENKNKFVFVHFVKNFENLNKSSFIVHIEPSIEYNHFRSIELLPESQSKLAILDLIANGKIWYGSNMAGVYFNNFWCQSHRLDHV